MNTIDVSWSAIEGAVEHMWAHWERKPTRVYGVPRGGCTVAAMLAARYGLALVDDEEGIDHRTLVVDDLVDSGVTLKPYVKAGVMCDALFRKPHSPHLPSPSNPREIDGWLVFPWERAGEAAPTDAVIRLLEYVGEDPSRDGLLDTPTRVVNAMREMCSGYDVDVAELLSTRFQHNGYDGLVACTGIDFVSLCEHHLLPFTGVAHVAYIPSPEHVVGLSKLARVVDAFARRLQMQETLTQQIADAIQEHLDPVGVGVVVRAHHACMSCRGVRKAGAEMVTSSLRGALFDDPRARAEFMALTA